MRHASVPNRNGAAGLLSAMAIAGLTACGGGSGTTTATTTTGNEGKSFIGNRTENLGPITIEKESTIEWTNDGFYFAIFTNEGVPVNSYAHGGTAVLKASTYTKFLVNALGRWTIKIVPK
jgi:hypothetical protein